MEIVTRRVGGGIGNNVNDFRDLDYYLNSVKSGFMNVDDVPPKYRETVRNMTK